MKPESTDSLEQMATGVSCRLELINRDVRRTRDLAGLLCEYVGEGDDLSLAQQVSINLAKTTTDLLILIEEACNVSKTISENEVSE